MDVYQRFFEFAPDAVLVIELKGCITMVNAQTETIFGYKRDELIGGLWGCGSRSGSARATSHTVQGICPNRTSGR